MKPKAIKASKSVVAETPDDIGRILGLTPGDMALMKYKAELSRLAVKSIQESGLTIKEIVKRSGVARSKVSAIKNGATVSVSCDLLVKIIGATGVEIQPNAAWKSQVDKEAVAEFVAATIPKDPQISTSFNKVCRNPLNRK
jgi:predicted XRE-type DNA-binding protein